MFLMLSDIKACRLKTFSEIALFEQRDAVVDPTSVNFLHWRPMKNNNLKIILAQKLKGFLKLSVENASRVFLIHRNFIFITKI